MHFTPTNLTDFMVSTLLASSCLMLVIALLLRFAVRPLLADWIKFKGASGASPVLERRLTEMEEDIRQLKAGAGLQLPAESLRVSTHSRT